ncbi:MAG: hypothetical protein A2W11_03690 [Ignavibacteria bacterium RBG_16_35_7]|nr:MAG: hypothetical protein A2W11_03690 [Ignavibacteria bacterium RBG_16_35_7]
MQNSRRLIKMNDKNNFKYNMSFYYQSTIIYFVVFVIYLVIRGQFIEDSYTLVTKDPIIYFFGIIVLVSLLSLLFNLYKNKHVQIGDDGIHFIDRFKKRSFLFNEMDSIKISKFKSSRISNKAFRLIRIKLNNRRRPLIIRPYDYENQIELLNRFQEIKQRLESR